jgi:sortase B
MSQSAKGANGKAGKHTGGKNGKKKPKSGYTFKDILKIYIPWRGDSVSEAVRKIVFFSALSVVGVCTFLISNYYIDLYKARAEYEAMQAEVEAARARRGFDDDESTEETKIGETIEYLDYNYVADRFLSQNPDLVGYVKIPNTLVSYPVVQKKSKDPNENTNDYYLYRTFHQEQSKSGCIFMDFRCHFDEVAEHRRVVKNSDNIVIYGHNMNNQTMFGSLRNYINNPYYYMDHPVVEFDSCYESYDYKIFAVFVVSGDDFDSEYSFDCWNDIDFKDEDAFYEYVNNAKKRTMINTNVDVQYGDPILTLYTCNGLVKNAKLILTCRRVRPHEDLESGTQDATLNDNVLYPKEYYDYGHPMNFDASRFVPYGPSDS